jgi:NhaP-type Na+/H+ or K+/H+ antiporter
MDSTTIVIGAIAGAAAAYFATMSQRKQSQKLVPSIESALRAQGAMTMPVLAEAIGFKGIMARGKVALALNDLVTQKKVRVIPAPDGTPQLQKVNHIKYELIG